MYTYKLKKDGTEFLKLFDINYPYTYLLDNGELYYFDENHINSFFRYRIDGTNDYYLKNDNIFESNKILISTGITDININLDATLENNTSYKFYLANKQIETVLFNENDYRIFVDQEGIYTAKLGINPEVNNIVADIKVGDIIILEKDGIKYYFYAGIIHPDGIEFSENLNINPAIDLSGAKVSIYGNNYIQIDNTKLDGNSTINLVDTLGENNGILYYKLELFSDDLKTSPVVNSVEVSEYKLKPPINLKQYIKSPLLEKEEVYLGMKIGKFQSGSGVILEAYVVNSNINQKIVFNVYNSGSTIPVITKETGFISGGTTGIILPYIGPGDYYWEAYTEDINGNKSEILGFGGNLKGETDYSLFEGFEPYPYGFKFENSSPSNGLLTGGIKWFKLEYLGLDFRQVVPGIKWDIFNKVFPKDIFSNKIEMLDIFEMYGLTKINPSIFYEGNCYGLSLIATSFKKEPSLIQKFSTNFYNLIKNGTIYNNVKLSTDENGYWNNYDLNEKINTILSAQLSQKNINYANASYLSRKNETPIEILNRIKNNKDKLYILSFRGAESSTGIIQGHAVVPYRVEGNKIYIWDNNVPYPNIIKNNNIYNSYEQYIEILGKGKNDFKLKYYNENFNWDYFTNMSLVDLDTIYGNTGNIAMGFNDNDLLFSYRGGGNIYIEDPLGKLTGYKDGIKYEEIPGSYIVNSIGVTNNLNTNIEKIKEIYFSKNIDGLTLKLESKSKELYDLMIAGGDYYIKIGQVETHTGDLDVFEIKNNEIKIDFDDNKKGDYSLLVDNFQETLTGTVYIENTQIIKGVETYKINWNLVKENSDEAILYELDKNNDGIIDETKELSPLVPEKTNTSKISGYIYFDRNKNGKKDKIDKKLRNFKVYLDLNNDGKLQKKTEPYTKTNKKGYYEFKNLKSGEYKVRLGDKGMKFIKRLSRIIDLNPKEGYYDIDLGNGKEVENKDFVISMKLKKRIKHKKHK